MKEKDYSTTWMSGRHSGVSVRGRECSDYRLDRMESVAIADPETGSSPGNLLHLSCSGSSATCSSPPKYDKLDRVRDENFPAIPGNLCFSGDFQRGCSPFEQNSLGDWWNLTKFKFNVNSVPRCKLDGNWLRRFQLNQPISDSFTFMAGIAQYRLEKVTSRIEITGFLWRHKFPRPTL
jgi:hypothetical protein